MKPLTQDELLEKLKQAKGWKLDHAMLVRECVFPSFPAAIAFVQQVAGLAEQAQHHPDIDIRYDHVRLALSTHDAGGITVRDFALAQQIDAIA